MTEVAPRIAVSIDGLTPPKDERKPNDMAGGTPCAVRVTVRY